MTENLYICEKCHYSTTIKCNYKRHLKTKKHLSNNFLDISESAKSKPEVSQSKPEVSQGKPEVSQENNPLKCPYCNYIFKHKQSLSKHKNRNRCLKKNNKNFLFLKKNLEKKLEKNLEKENIITNNINNGTINNNNINIVFNINSIEEAEEIKKLLTPNKILEICNSEKSGLNLKSSDYILKIQNFSLQSKKENKSLQYFRKTNARDNYIDVKINDKYEKMEFDQYNRTDLLKTAKTLLDLCEKNKTYDENLNHICEVLSEYDYYSNLNENDKQGVDNVIKAIKDCEKKSKIEHYNITKNN